MSEKEIWKKIDNSYYEISSFGRFKNSETKRISISTGGKKRYHCISYKTKDNEYINTSIHKLVAKYFIPNPKNKPYVNHKDGNKMNNNMKNLEWVTHSENMIHAYKTGLNPGGSGGGIELNQLNEKGEIINTFKSIKEAYEKTGINGNRIRDSIKLNEGIKIKKIKTKKYKKEKETDIKHKCPGCNFTSNKYSLINHLRKKIKCNSLLTDNKIKNYIDNVLLKKEYIFCYFQKADIYKNRENEKWKQIKEPFSEYYISNMGRVKRNDLILTGGSDNRYKRIKLVANSLKKGYAIHRLVAEYFIPNPNNKPNVNHKDGNSFNNNVNNLEWCTQKENMQHAYITGLCNHTKRATRKIYQLELDGSIIKEWPSIKEAEKYYSSSSISTVCCSFSNKTKNTHHCSGGYGWCWKNHYEKKINPTILKIFPELEDMIKNNEIIDFNLIRNYTNNFEKPIWQLELDGTRLKLWNSGVKIAKHFNTTNQIFSRKIFQGYGWEYASYKSIKEPNNYKKTPNTIITKYFPYIDWNKSIDFDLIRKCINLEGKASSYTYPIWKIDKNGKRLKIITNRIKEEINLGGKNGINMIEGCIRGKMNIAFGFIWEYGTFYKDDNNIEGNYNIIPLKDRIKNKITKNTKCYKTMPINQYDLKGNFIKEWKNRNLILKELKLYTKLSSKYNSKYIFRVKEK